LVSRGVIEQFRLKRKALPLNLSPMTEMKPPQTPSSQLASMDQRARDVFKHLVDTYIQTGEPVGSRTISKALPATLSPASIRNVMTDLEDAGLISSPHTSAGRIPTDFGLRFFVDALLQVGSISSEERARIDAQVRASNRARKVEDVLGDATSLLSGLSSLTSVVLTPKLNARLKHIEFVNLSSGRALVILVTEDGSVENRIIDVAAGLPPSAFMRATNYLSAKAEGKTLAEVQSLVMREVESLRGELDDVSARLVEGGLAVWTGDDNPDAKSLIVRGQAHLLEDAKATADLDRVRKLFDDIESKRELAGLLGSAEQADGVRIFIGAESRMFSLSGSSLIAAPFRNEDEKIVGVLGIIGPTRLNYARIIPMVDYTAKAVGKLLS
jgi:heat-inducible transcriptional repressor